MKGRALIGIITASLAFANVAYAETPDQLFERGRSLAVAQRYAEACPLLAESVKAEAGIGARLWLGECYEKTGRLASALAEFKAAAEQARTRHDAREKVAGRRVAGLEPRVPRIVVAAPEGVVLSIDGVAAAAGVADPVDAGLHTVTAAAEGFVKWSASVSVPDGVVTVNVPPLAPVTVAEEPPAPRAPPARAPERPVIVSSPGLGPMKIASIATGALGLAALGGGVFLGLQAKSTYDDSNQGHCVENACDVAGKDLRRSATSMATLSTIAFAGAGAALASSIVLFVLSPSTTLVPSAGPRDAGLSITTRF
jgi:hypothetical protein